VKLSAMGKLAKTFAAQRLVMKPPDRARRGRE
jgi:hypothetical protein